MVKTDNELIAEFMGMKYRKGYGPLTGETYDEVKQTPNANWQSAYFHKSWDWLMPVVEKIYRLEKDDQRIARFSLQNSRAVIKSGKKVFSCHTISAINSTYRVVVEFIKWYNESKP
jgi:hypothetical protein